MGFARALGSTAAAIAAAASALAAPAQHMLDPAGPQAERIHALWLLTVGLCVLVFAAVLAAFLLALWRAPRGDADTPPDLSSLAGPERRPRQIVTIAVAVSAVLLMGLVFASAWTDRALARMSLHDALHVRVTAKQFWWELRYDDPEPSRMFSTANELHVPVGRPVILTLESEDVIHSLWVPNLAGKKDLIPGRSAQLRFRADREGTFRGQCAEFCGWQHARMALIVVAEPRDRWEAWADGQRRSAPQPTSDAERRGREVFEQASCAMCHRIQGTAAAGRKGPDLTHLASRSTLAAGTMPNTTGHLAGWIVDPQGIKPGVNMPASTLAPDDLQALLAFLGSLR
jgi:cytochrome c oxidase subunit 2